MGGDLRPRPPHFPPAPRSVIMLMQVGGPSQIDLFDPKPELQQARRPGVCRRRRDAAARQRGQEADGQPVPVPAATASSGMEISELLPHIGSVADELCLVRSMFSDNNNHPQATRCLNTGKIFPGRPALGSWISYALGTREPEPAGLRRAARSRRLQQRRHDAVGKRLAAGPVSAAPRSSRAAPPCSTCTRRWPPPAGIQENRLRAWRG